MNTTTGLCIQNRKLGWISSISILNPEDAACETLKKFFRGKEIIIPGTINKLFMLLDSILPSSIKNKLTSKAI